MLLHSKSREHSRVGPHREKRSPRPRARPLELWAAAEVRDEEAPHREVLEALGAIIQRWEGGAARGQASDIHNDPMGEDGWVRRAQ